MAAGRRRPIRLLTVMGLAAVAVVLAPGAARAQIGSDRYSALIMEAASGRVLIAASPEEPRHPASLTKMMTLYMVFEALRDRRISINQLVPVSAHAASMSPTKLGLVPGARITVEEAILGLVTKSANDAAAALGEMLAGDEDRFGQMMTLRARALGMSRSVFHNASGLPDPDQWSTAYDMALLGRHLVQDFPIEYRYFSTPSFRFRGKPIMSHDRMLTTYPGADGIKTGYTEASGFNLVTSAVRGNVRLIGVVLGAAHAGERDIHMAALLDQGFGRMDVPVMPPPAITTQEAAARAIRREPAQSLIPAAHAATLPPPTLPPSALQQPALRQVRWSVLIGTFPTEAAARQAAAAARRLAGVGDIRIERQPARPAALWRAQLGDMTDAEARGTCAALARRRQACTLLRPEPGQYASR